MGVPILKKASIYSGLFFVQNSHYLVIHQQFLYLIAMKFTILLITLFTSIPTMAENCVYGISLCSTNQACIKIDQNIAQCIPHPNHLPSVIFPMKAQAGIYCDQGNLSTEGNSHIYTNTAYALDLASNRSADAGVTLAASAGTVISYFKCKNKNDLCGNGFGNYVQILRDDGYLIFYAHLDKVLVQTGDEVKVGQEIGIEGNTGWTGENNRHLHFSVHFNWRELGFETLKNNIGWLPNSVPFKMINTDSRDFKCTRSSGSLEWLAVKGL